MSGYDPDSVRGSAALSGEEMIEKPFTTQTLTTRVRAVLDAAARHREAREA